MSNNNGSPTAAKPSAWAKYHTARLEHTRKLRALAETCRDAPRCPKCQIVIALWPADERCSMASCPLSPSTADSDTLRMP